MRKEINARGGPVTNLEMVVMCMLSILPMVNLLFMILIIFCAIVTWKEHAENTKQTSKRFIEK